MGKRENSPVMGCDIGNAYAYVSVAESSDRDPTVLMKEEYIKTGMPTSAFVPESPDEPIQVCDLKLGTPAKLMRTHPTQVVEAVKRCFTQNTITLKVSGIKGTTTRTVKPEEVYAAIVRDLVIMANASRTKVKREPIYDLVFTYPAAFLGDNKARERMQDAIESVSIDGHKLHVVSSLPEPAAVALDHLYYTRQIQPGSEDSKPKGLTVLVVDLGHGSLDLAVVTATDQAGERPYVVHSYGTTPTPLGGIDFDYALGKHIRELLKNECNWNKPFSATQEEQIWQEAKRIKHLLTDTEKAVLELDLLTDAGITTRPSITRDTFEKLTEDILAQILEQTEDQLQKALSDGMKIDRIILSGGGSHMPMIKKNIEKLVRNQYPVEAYRPERAVSYGAARYASHLPKNGQEPVETPGEDFETTSESGGGDTSLLRQKANYSYGLRYEDPLRKEYRVKFLIPYQSSLPMTKEVDWPSGRIDLDMDIRRSKTSVKTGDEAPLDATTDIVNKTFHGVPKGPCTVTMTVDEEHHISVTCRFGDGTILKHGTGKHRNN